MKNNYILPFLFALLLSGLNSKAATLIVNSHFPQPAGVYSTILLAYNAASPGDTILVSPSDGEYLGITIAKEVHIVGTGWEPYSESVPYTKASHFTVHSDGGGSSITGFEVNGNFDIYASNVTIQRNKCKVIIVRNGCNNVVIKQNFISDSKQSTAAISSAVVVLYSNAQVTLTNNIIINTNINTSYSRGIYAQYPVNVFINNNVIRTAASAIMLDKSGDNFSTHSIQNNIVVNGIITGAYDGNVSYNIGNSTQFVVGNNNQQNVDMYSVFVDTDNLDFHLLEESPAIDAGFGETDCGIYGGVFPFVDNGRSWLPAITGVNVPVLVNINDGLNISVTAKSGE